MPHLLLSATSQSDLPALWNVDMSVGKGGTNALNDVYMVQYLMQMIGKANKFTTSAGVAWCKKASQLLTTGHCDAFTITCITDYQSVCKGSGLMVTVDGRVSRSTPSYTFDTGVYTISCLNYDYKCAYWHNWPCIDLDNVSRPLAVRDMCYQQLYGTKPTYAAS